MSAAPKKKGAKRPQSGEEIARLNADLLQAAYDGSLDGVKAALEQGASIDAAHEATGLTALHIAVGTHNLALTRYLVEEHDAPFGPDRFGRWQTVVAAECRVDEALADYIVEQEAYYLGKNPK